MRDEILCGDSKIHMEGVFLVCVCFNGYIQRMSLKLAFQLLGNYQRSQLEGARPANKYQLLACCRMIRKVIVFSS